MVRRMIGSRVGTGGSSGEQYLQGAVNKNYIFKELAGIITFLIERRNLPALPARLRPGLALYFYQPLGSLFLPPRIGLASLLRPSSKNGYEFLRAETRTRNESFNSTRWTLVLRRRRPDATPSQSLEALSELCRIYWRPLYLFLRRAEARSRGCARSDARLFAHLIESRAYARADPDKGRFRSFLLGALKHFVAHARAHDRTQKRGGGMILAAARHGRDRRGGCTSRELADLEC